MQHQGRIYAAFFLGQRGCFKMGCNYCRPALKMSLSGWGLGGGGIQHCFSFLDFLVLFPFSTEPKSKGIILLASSR